MIVIGITGGIGTGKSVVSKILKEELNLDVIDADELARKAVEQGSLGLKRITEEFGTEVLKKDKTLDRKALGDIIFNDESKRNALNSIVHPEVARLYAAEIEKYRSLRREYVIYDCPLLIEASLAKKVDVVILVRADRQTQVRRIMERNGVSIEEANRRVDAQMPGDEKEKYADIILWNDGSLEELKRAILSMWRNLF